MNNYDFLKDSNNFFINFPSITVSKTLTLEIIEKLNQNKLIIISGFYSIGKTNIISHIIKKSNYNNNFIYINKNFDINNILKNEYDLEKAFNFFLKEKKIKLIILENVNNIKNIKNFINNNYKKGYKIIIIGNDIKVGNKPEIEIFENKKTFFYYYGYNNKNQKDFYYIENTKNIIYKTNNIILKEILETYSIKNFDLCNYSLKFLAKNNKLDSLSNFSKEISNIIKISKVTFLEYLKFFKQSKIIKQIFLYDFKRNKIIENKTKFYFCNLDFRNSLNNFLLDEKILKENFLFLELEKRGFEIFSAKNGVYNFTFLARKAFSNGILQKIYYIEFCDTKNKTEFKKILHKIQKVPEFKNSIISKILIIENQKELSIKKIKYNNLEILSLNDFLKKI